MSKRKESTKRKQMRKLAEQRKARTAQLSGYAYRNAVRQVEAELIFERWLSKLGIRYRYQWLLEPYIADFYLPDVGVVIEIDGDSHDKQREYDGRRDRAMLRRLDVVEIVRYTNEEVMAGDIRIKWTSTRIPTPRPTPKPKPKQARKVSVTIKPTVTRSGSRLIVSNKRVESLAISENI